MKRFNLRSYVGAVVFTIVTFSLCFLSVIFQLFGGRKGASKIMSFWGHFILKTGGIQMEIEGLENLDPDEPAIVMSNHASMIDIPVLFAALPLHLRFIYKHSLAYIPIFGQVLPILGHISINRGNRTKSFQSLRRAGESIRSGIHVLIFPEGTRSQDAELLNFKKGGFVLALQEKLSIVPISLSHTRTVCPRSSILTCSGKVKVHIHPSISAADYTIEQRGELMARVQQVMDSELERDPAEMML